MLINVYALRATADELVEELRFGEPETQAKAAYEIGTKRVFGAIPYLWGAVTYGTDLRLRNKAYEAIDHLVPFTAVKVRADAGMLDNPTKEGFGERLVEAAEAIFDLFRPRREATNAPSEPRPDEQLLRREVAEFLLTFAIVNERQIGEQALDAYSVVGNLARHLEILPEEAGPKNISWQDTLERLRRYDEKYTNGK